MSADGSRHTGGSRLTDSNHAAGAAVYSPDGNRIGRIERVKADETTGEIASAVVRFTSGNFMDIEAAEHTVPWSLLTYNSRFDGYELGVST